MKLFSFSPGTARRSGATTIPPPTGSPSNLPASSHRSSTRHPTGAAAVVFASLYGQMVVERGKLIGALPDGRNAGTPVAKNLDACISMDRNGITALMESVVKLDLAAFPCGTCLDLMLHPSAVQGTDGITAIAAVIRTFIAEGGSGCSSTSSTWRRSTTHSFIRKTTATSRCASAAGTSVSPISPRRHSRPSSIRRERLQDERDTGGY